MTFFNYMRSVIKSGSMDSSKTFALIAATLASTFLVICIGFCLCWDVISNGVIDTDTETLSWIIIALSTFMGGSAIPKVFGEKYGK